MNLLCLLFGIQCRAKQTTRARFTSPSGVVIGNAEFDHLPANVQTMLDELDMVDIDDLTLEQLEEVLQALINAKALFAAQRLTYLIRDKLDRDYLEQVARNAATRTHIQDLING